MVRTSWEGLATLAGTSYTLIFQQRNVPRLCMTYACIHDRDKLFKLNHLQVSARRDLCSCPRSLLQLDMGKPTRRGEKGQRDSILDLVWVNQLAWEEGFFGGPSLSWDNLHHSDHALICIPCIFPSKIQQLTMDCNQGFHMNTSLHWMEILILSSTTFKHIE